MNSIKITLFISLILGFISITTMADNNDGTYKRVPILTKNAPQPIGSYSQAIAVDSKYKSVYLSGTIPLNEKNELVNQTVEAQVRQVFTNMKNVAEASGGSLKNVVKVNVFLTDLKDMAVVNEIMPLFFEKPYPARSTVKVAGLAMNVAIEIDGEMRI